MIRPLPVALITMACLWAVPPSAAAQQLVIDPPALFAAMTAPAGGDWQTPVRVSPARRGPVLPALYVGLIGLQVYDGYSTRRGLSLGAIESNALMSKMAGHPGTLWAAKGATALVSVYAAERLWRKGHRTQAIVWMALSNGLMAAVAANNASIISRLR